MQTFAFGVGWLQLICLRLNPTLAFDPVGGHILTRSIPAVSSIRSNLPPSKWSNRQARGLPVMSSELPSSSGEQVSGIDGESPVASIQATEVASISPAAAKRAPRRRRRNRNPHGLKAYLRILRMILLGHPPSKKGQARRLACIDIDTKVYGTGNEWDVRNLPGITAPLGFFDPLHLATDISEGKYRFFREVELKHGRVAMLAAVGFPLAEHFHPFFGGNIDVPSYIAFQQTPLQTSWELVLLAFAIPEAFSVAHFNSPFWKSDYLPGYAWPNVEPWSIRSNHYPGDFGFDPLGLKPTNAEDLKIMRTKELNNGRLAMIAMLGMVAQELVTGQKLF